MSRTVKIIDVNRYRGMDPLEMPNYGMREAALYLNIKPSTLQRWTRGRTYTVGGKRVFSPPLIRLPFKDTPELSPLNLVEAYVLDAIRMTYNIPLSKVRSAVRYATENLGAAHPLAKKVFQTDGIDFFVKEAADLINVSMKGKVGQMALRDLVEPYLERIDYDEQGLPVRLFLITRREKRPDAPKMVEIRPRISGGRPVIAGTRILIQMIEERFKAGDSVPELMQDYGLTQEQVEEGIRSWSILRDRIAKLRGYDKAA